MVAMTADKYSRHHSVRSRPEITTPDYVMQHSFIIALKTVEYNPSLSPSV